MDRLSFSSASLLLPEFPRAEGGMLGGPPAQCNSAGDGVVVAAEGSQTEGLTTALAFIGSLAGAASAATVGGLISGVAGATIAVIKGVEIAAREHKEHGNSNTNPMAMDRAMDKK